MGKEMKFKVKERREVEKRELKIKDSLLSIFEAVSKVLIMSYSLALKNIKRRKIRSTLTFIGITVMVIAFVLSTSITVGFSIERYEKKFETNFYGLDISSRYISEFEKVSSKNINITEEGERLQIVNIGIPPSLVDELRNDERAKLVVPRIRSEFTYVPTLNVITEKRMYRTYAIMGIVPSLEDKLRNFSELVVEGRYLKDDDKYAILISKRMADLQNLKIGDSVKLFLNRFGYDEISVEIVGFFDAAKIAQTKRSFGGELLPKGRPLKEIYPYPEEKKLGIGPSEKSLVIAPISFVQELLQTKRFSEVDVVPREGVTVEELDNWATKIAKVAELQIYVCDGKESYAIWSLKERQYAKLGPSFVVLGIAALGIFNTMLSSVYERKGEIATMTSVGASPGTVTQIFLAEASVFGFFSGFLGYGVAIFVMILSNQFELGLPPVSEKLNWYWFTLSVGGSFLTALVTTYYPASQAGKLVVPSLMRRWRPSALKTVINDIKAHGGEDRMEDILPVSLDIEEFDAFTGYIWDKLYRPMFYYLYDAWKKDLSKEDKLVKAFGFTTRVVDSSAMPIILVAMMAEKDLNQKRARVKITMEFSEETTIAGSSMGVAVVKSNYLYNLYDEIRKIVLEYKVLRSKISPEQIKREILIKPEEVSVEKGAKWNT